MKKNIFTIKCVVRRHKTSLAKVVFCLRFTMFVYTEHIILTNKKLISYYVSYGYFIDLLIDEKTTFGAQSARDNYINKEDCI